MGVYAGKVNAAEPRASHWDEAYRTGGPQGVSWFQPAPTNSLDLIHALGVEPVTPVIDVGGGASRLVDRLLAAGFADITVLDVSETALEASRRQVGATDKVTWVQADIVSWTPGRRYGLWHDRAVFHFLTDVEERRGYLETMQSALVPGGRVVVATFAEDGPERCSGLPVARYSVDELLSVLGGGFTLSEYRRELHRTPTGVVQPFTWVAGSLAT